MFRDLAGAGFAAATGSDCMLAGGSGGAGPGSAASSSLSSSSENRKSDSFPPSVGDRSESDGKKMLLLVSLATLPAAVSVSDDSTSL